MNGIRFYKRRTTWPRKPAALAPRGSWQGHGALIWTIDHFLPDTGPRFTVINGPGSPSHLVANSDPSGAAARWLLGAQEYGFQIDHKSQ